MFSYRQRAPLSFFVIIFIISTLASVTIAQDAPPPPPGFEPNVRLREVDAFQFVTDNALVENIVAQDMVYMDTIEYSETIINGTAVAGNLNVNDVVIIDPEGRHEFAVVTGLTAVVGSTRCPVNNLISTGHAATITLYGNHKAGTGDVIVRIDDYYQTPDSRNERVSNAYAIDFVVEEVQPGNAGILATGTILNGTLETGARLALRDLNGEILQEVSIDAITVNNVPAEIASATEKVTLQLPGIDREMIGRCSRISSP